MKDPVCGMTVAEPPKYSSVWKGQTYGFCAERCQKSFEANPESYLTSKRANFTPLILIFSGILPLSVVFYYFRGGSTVHHAMTGFMGIFFLVFAGFKLLDLKGFADAYSTYDVVAKKSRIYGLIYPFIEVALGLLYLRGEDLFWVNVFTAILMGISSIGVAQALFQKRMIQCACLGTKIKLPMTKITLFEDLLMFMMALGMMNFS